MYQKTMNLSKVEILKLINVWLAAWDEHDLEGVVLLMDENIVFENWTGATIIGKNNLQKAWAPWFRNHGNFKFTKEDIFVDQQEQKVLFSWSLQWPSPEKDFKGKTEVRRGVDVLHFKNGKICRKYSYSKTTIQIDSFQVALTAQ
jgi:ketosteroid isomerase-like protein